MKGIRAYLERIAAVLMTVCMLTVLAPAADYGAAYASEGWSMTAIESYLKKTGDVVAKDMVNSYGYEWNAIDLMCDGRSVSSEYFDSVVQAVKDREGNLGSNGGSFTDNCKAVLALTCGGYDATDIGGYNLLDNFADYDNAVKGNSVYSPVYTLLALDCADYEIPEVSQGCTQATREKYIEKILELRLTDSGLWSWGSTPDVDTTAMVLVALAPYYDKDEAVKTAVDNAINYLSEQMNENGVYPSTWGDPCSNTVATVIWALCANGIDPATDSRFVKNGTSLMDGMMSFVREDGSFGYQDNIDKNDFATQQCYEAMIAYHRLLSGKNRVYDFRSKVGSMSLSKITYNYSGKSLLPSVTVKDINGRVLNKNTDYTVSYKNNKYVGTAIVTVTAKGPIYSDTITKTFTINPVGTSIKSLTRGRKSFTVKLSKKSSQVSGYQVRYSTRKSFSTYKTKTLTSYKKTSTKVSSLKARRTYYVKARTYKTVNGKRYYSAWSSTRRVKTR